MPSISIGPLLKSLLIFQFPHTHAIFIILHAYPVTQSLSIHGMTTALTDDPRGFDRQTKSASETRFASQQSHGWHGNRRRIIARKLPFTISRADPSR